MNSKWLVCIVLLSCFLSGLETNAMSDSSVICPSQTFKSSLKIGEALKIYDQVTRIVTNQFYDKTYGGSSWPELQRDYRLCVNSKSGQETLETVLNDLLGNLHASHTEFVTSKDQEYHGLASIFSHSLSGDRI